MPGESLEHGGVVEGLVGRRRVDTENGVVRARLHDRLERAEGQVCPSTGAEAVLEAAGGLEDLRAEMPHEGCEPNAAEAREHDHRANPARLRDGHDLAPGEGPDHGGRDLPQRQS
eukprot:13028312-Alexandrium_andersonii.AAC.1